MLKEIELGKSNPFDYQHIIFCNLIRCGRETAFGKEHHFDGIKNLSDFQKNIPISDYNAIAPYIERQRNGEEYVLWNQKVKWYAKSSGTSSSKSKFIPVTPDSLKITHFKGMTEMLACYINNHPDSKLFCGSALTLGGSVKPGTITSHSKAKIYSGDLSAVMLENSPAIVELVRTPKKSTALMPDFNKKVEQICKESTRRNVTNFSGVPSWNLILLNRILEYTGKSNLLEIWPNLELFMHGGTGFEQYKPIYQSLIPTDNMHYLENYNASEGYFAFQDNLSEEGMLLTLNNGIFYEFVPLENLKEALAGDNSKVVTLEGAKTGINYAIIISTYGGLWRYLPEDTVKFVSTFPHKIIISGRTKLYINAFGEELMISNAEKAIASACRICNCAVAEFTVAPEFMNFCSADKNTSGSHSRLKKGRHIWAIEFEREPSDVSLFANILDTELTKANSDYEAKRCNNATMQRLEIKQLKKGTFLKWMTNREKLGGQNKIPRLWKDLSYIRQLEELQQQ